MSILELAALQFSRRDYERVNEIASITSFLPGIDGLLFHCDAESGYLATPLHLGDCGGWKS